MDASTEMLRKVYAATGGAIPLVGCGGVSDGKDAYRKIRAGASLVQLYTAFAYQGPGMLPRMKRELLECLDRDGFASVREAVGAAHRRGEARGADRDEGRSHASCVYPTSFHIFYVVRRVVQRVVQRVAPRVAPLVVPRRKRLGFG